MRTLHCHTTLGPQRCSRARLVIRAASRTDTLRRLLKEPGILKVQE
jgi:hypothetical protein